jgi:hypothetical protein
MKNSMQSSKSMKNYMNHKLYSFIIRDRRDNYLINVYKFTDLHEGYKFVKNRYPNDVITCYDLNFNIVSPDIYMQAE